MRLLLILLIAQYLLAQKVSQSKTDDGVTSTKAVKPPKTPEVVMISELFRHGARYPYANPDNEKLITEGNANLIEAGEQQHYKLGKAIRKTYPKLFSKNFNYDEANFIASNYERTLKSGYCHMMGIWDLGSGYTLKTENSKYINPPYKGLNPKSFFHKTRKFSLNKGTAPFQIFTTPVKYDKIF